MRPTLSDAPLVSFFVPGVPAPGGSKKAFVNPKTRKIVVLDDAKNNRGWRERVAFFGRQAWRGDPADGTPLELHLTFTFLRPKSHYRAGRNAALLRADAPRYPTVRPDLTKTIRSSEDALTGILWRDDSQVVRQVAAKQYGQTPGLRVELYEAV